MGGRGLKYKRQTEEDVLKLIGRQKKLKSDEDRHVILSLACETTGHVGAWRPSEQTYVAAAVILLMKYVFLLSKNVWSIKMLTQVISVDANLI